MKKKYLFKFNQTHLYLHITKDPTIMIRTKKLEPTTPIKQVGPQGPFEARKIFYFKNYLSNFSILELNIFEFGQRIFLD